VSDYAGVILAAGQGKRMGALGKEYPKTLLPVGDEPVIGHQLRMFNRLGVKEVYVVIGHLGTKVSEVVGTGSDYGVAIQYIEQGPPLGSAFALGRLKSVISRPFLVTLGDYYFEITDAERMIDRLENKVSAISAKYERDYNLLREGCELRVSSHSRLEGIVENPEI
jgi:NDP-sugar pyrophosphorylase family protein